METNTVVEVAKESQGTSPVLWIIILVVLLAIGIFVIPKLMKKFGGKLYKRSAKSITVDLDKLGPEIVKKEKTTNENTKED